MPLVFFRNKQRLEVIENISFKQNEKKVFNAFTMNSPA